MVLGLLIGLVFFPSPTPGQASPMKAMPSLRAMWEQDQPLEVLEELNLQPDFQEQVLGGSFRQAYGLIEAYLDSMINDEDWETWNTFRRKPGQVLPWASTDRLVFKVTPKGSEAAQIGVGARGLLVQTNMPEPGRVGVGWIKESYGPKDKHKLITLHANQLEVFRERRSPWDPFWLLTDSENIYVERPWDWESVLPRMTTVAGFLLLGILAVELVRTLLGIGRRRRKQD